jgi:hypothetical protein
VPKFFVARNKPFSKYKFFDKILEFASYTDVSKADAIISKEGKAQLHNIFFALIDQSEKDLNNTITVKYFP